MVVISDMRLADVVIQHSSALTFLIVKTLKSACAVPINERPMVLYLSMYFWTISQEEDDSRENAFLKCLKVVIRIQPVTYLKYKALTMTKGTKK
jgi:hypothetical protein